MYKRQCQCFVHAPHRTEFTAHAAGIAVIFFRRSAVADGSRRFRIQGALVLRFPVQLLPCIRHTVVDVPCSRNALGDIRCVSRDLGCDDTLFRIFNVRQRKVLRRCNVAQEGCSAHSRYRSADGRRDVIVSRRDVGNDRSQYIERCSHADALLHLHVGRHLIEGHMSRTFYHDLYVVIPRPLGQLAQTD